MIMRIVVGLIMSPTAIVWLVGFLITYIILWCADIWEWILKGCLGEAHCRQSEWFKEEFRIG